MTSAQNLLRYGDSQLLPLLQGHKGFEHRSKKGSTYVYHKVEKLAHSSSLHNGSLDHEVPNRDIAVRLASPGIAQSQVGVAYMPMLGKDGHIEDCWYILPSIVFSCLATGRDPTA